MKIKTLLTIGPPLIFSMTLTGCLNSGSNAYNAGIQAPAMAGGQTGQMINNAGRVLQAGQQVATASQALKSPGLTDLLVQQLGVSPAQAQSGAGALFQVAKSQMQANAFAKIEQSVPGMQSLLGAAPQVQQPSALGGLLGGMSSMSNGYGNNAGSMLSLVSAFQQQGMSAGMVQQFIPIIVNYVSSQGGAG